MATETNVFDKEALAPRLNEFHPLISGHQQRCSEWFTGAGLGLFICLDHASQQGIEMSWPMLGDVNFALPLGGLVTVDQYRSTESTFNPTQWNPKDFLQKAKDAGCKYAVFTAKHHSGWAIWPSKFGGKNISTSIFQSTGRDILREYVDAAREVGIKVGIYYSLADWGHEGYLEWKDEYRPYVFGVSPPMGTSDQWESFRQYTKDQLTELLTQYGPVDLLWFDGAWERSDETWNSKDFGDHIRSISPNTLINDRLFTQGDYRTPEQWIPAKPLNEPWECCMTINYSWAYVPTDKTYKSTYEILRTLIEVVSRGGNLLLNVGPKPDGTLATEEAQTLDDLAVWMKVNKESIEKVTPGLEDWQYYGPSTQRGDIVYLHNFALPQESVVVRGVKVARLKSATVLGSSEELTFTRRTAIHDAQAPDPDGEIIIDVRGNKVSGLMPVIVLDFGGKPSAVQLRNW